jgi:outer membrane translocation and assembly module TamA
MGYTDLRLPEGSPIAADAPLRGSDGFGQMGGRFEAAVDRNPGAEPRSGWALDVALEGYPAIWDAVEDFATAQAVARGYLDIPVGGRHPQLALRVGGRRAWGDWPVFEGAFIGGMETVRGYRYMRFLAEQSAWGNVELRAPLFEMTLLSRGRLGVLGLADAGRVWKDKDSPGGWHTAYGGGVFYETLGRAFTVLYARGEEDRWYLQIGMPF